MNCRSHCHSCGMHFESDAAFDLHRIGTFKKGRRCRTEFPKLKVVDETGACDMVGEKVKNVKIWGTL